MKRIEINDLFDYYFLSDPTFSPNGKRRLFIAHNCDKDNNTYKSFIYEIRDNKPYKLTGLGKESSFIFLNDDEILFSGNRDKKDEESPKTKYYKLNLNGGEAMEYMTIPLIVTDIYTLNDNKFLILGLINKKYPDLYKANEEETQKVLKEIKDNSDYIEIDEYPYVFNGQGYTNNIRTSLFIYDYNTKELKRINSNPLENIFSISVSKDKSEAFYTRCMFDKYESYLDVDLVHVDLNTLETKKVELKENIVPSDVLFGDTINYLILSDISTYGENSNNQVYTIDKDLNIKFLINPDMMMYGGPLTDVEFGGGYVNKVDNDNLYFLSNYYESVPIYRIDKNGKLDKYYDTNGGICSFDVYGGEIFSVNLTDWRPDEVYSSKDGKLSSFNDKALEDKYISIGEPISFINENGTQIDGYVLKPFDYKEGNKYPAILDIHGGPKCAYQNVFFHEMQVWASKGYFVMFCNPTGGDGRGDEFSDIRGKYGQIDYNDIMKFVDVVLENYKDIDENNLFETGGSYGGFMTNWIIGHTDRFKACVSQRSISNWSIMYGISDIGVIFTKDQQASDPFNDPEKCWWHSPLKYANNCKTPTLFIHSSEDYRCPLQEGLSMFTALVSNGCEARIVVFKGENHELSRSGKPLHRIKRLEEITNWFESHKS